MINVVRKGISMKKLVVIIAATLSVSLIGCSVSSEVNNTEDMDIVGEENFQDDASINSEAVTEELSYPSESYSNNFGESVSYVDGDEILITQSGTYEFTGDYLTSTIIVNVDKTVDEGVVYLILNDANIVSENSTPIHIMEAKSVEIVLEGENTIIQGAVVTDDLDFPSAAIYSKADTVIRGDGSLAVETLYQDGINSRDDLIIEGGTITISAVEDGVVGKDFVAISESNMTITAGKDGIKSSNDEDIDKGNLIISSGSFYIEAEQDGISAEQTLQIDGGSFTIEAGGGFVEVLNDITVGEGSGNVVQPSSILETSMKGIKGFDIILNDGEFEISSYEDTIHANNNVIVNGGSYQLLTGDDGLHADVDLVINDIQLEIIDGYEGIEGENVTINGGDIYVNVLDDAINASSESGYVKITDGDIYLKCKGDGIDSNGDLILEGGDLIIEVDAIYTGGDSELDVSGVITVSGGTIIDETGGEIDPTAQNGGTMPNRPSGNRR